METQTSFCRDIEFSYLKGYSIHRNNTLKPYINQDGDKVLVAGIFLHGADNKEEYIVVHTQEFDDPDLKGMIMADIVLMDAERFQFVFVLEKSNYHYFVFKRVQ